jgi:hypothetical protein
MILIQIDPWRSVNSDGDGNKNRYSKEKFKNQYN